MKRDIGRTQRLCAEPCPYRHITHAQSGHELGGLTTAIPHVLQRQPGHAVSSYGEAQFRISTLTGYKQAFDELLSEKD